MADLVIDGSTIEAIVMPNGEELELGKAPTLQSKSVSYTPTETAQSATVTPDTGYDGLDEVNVSVGAISNTYVGSGVARRTDSDLYREDELVFAPAGYYESNSKLYLPLVGVTASATKGVVSNNAISITPSVAFDTDGYVDGQSRTGTAVTVTASELVSGTKSITSNGTGIDVTNYASVDVAVPTPAPSLQTKSVSITPSETAQSQTVTPDSGYDGLDEVSVSVGAISSTYVGTDITRRSSTDLTASGATVSVPSGYYESNASKSVASGTEGTPTATKSTVSNHAISVTPSVTNSAGYISGGTHSGTAVTVSASELVSGSETKTANGTYDVTNLAELVVAVPLQTIYTGTSAPSSSTGSNGDVYIQTA